MQNFNLLRELGKERKPVLLKRGIAATIEELLLSAEYILAGGNYDVILCERGIRTFETYTRNTMDISAIPVVQKLSHLPIVADPSHGTGRRDKVAPMARAAVAAGADGLLIEVHPDPDRALSDGAQSLRPGQFEELMGQLRHDRAGGGPHGLMETVAIVGVGLIGGSFALALKKAGFPGRMLGVSSERHRCAPAIEIGAIDEGVAAGRSRGARRSDLLWPSRSAAFSTPCITWMRILRPGMLVTDAGSTKEAIVAQAARSMTRVPVSGRASDGRQGEARGG